MSVVKKRTQLLSTMIVVFLDVYLHYFLDDSGPRTFFFIPCFDPVHLFICNPSTIFCSFIQSAVLSCVPDLVTLRDGLSSNSRSTTQKAEVLRLLHWVSHTNVFSIQHSSSLKSPELRFFPRVNTNLSLSQIIVDNPLSVSVRTVPQSEHKSVMDLCKGSSSSSSLEDNGCLSSSHVESSKTPTHIFKVQKSSLLIDEKPL